MPRRASIILTARNVLTLPDGKYADAGRDGAGLTLLVRKEGRSRLYVHRYMRLGLSRQVNIGRVSRMGLDDARKAVRRLRARLDAGEAVSAKPKMDHPSGTFRDDAQAYANWRGDWGAKLRHDWLASMERHVYPLIGDRPTAALKPADLVPILTPIWHTETGQRVAKRIAAVIERAIATDDDRRFPDRINVAASIRHRMPQCDLIRENRQPMKYPMVPPLYQRLQASTAMASYALRFLLLTCAPRAAEVYDMRWSEVEGDVWLIPAGPLGRVKNKKPRPRNVRDIPLSSEASAILNAIRPEIINPRAYVFRGDGDGGRIGIHAMRNLLRSMGIDDDVHGFRTSFKSWALANMQHPLDKDAIEVAHDRAIGSAVAEAYRDDNLIRHRRILAERWAAYLHGREYVGPMSAPVLQMVG